MICQIFVVPSLFVIFQWLQEKVKPIQFENEQTQKVDTELLQYTRPVKTDK
jgi:HAE1 family hydrophobic/amphiphilic exporter-1